jgi:hypothetical protein
VSACDRKVRYTSRKEAENTRKAQEYRTGEGLRVYHCPPCKAYHLTHQPLGAGRRRADG